jgi:hypothetical protein
VNARKLALTLALCAACSKSGDGKPADDTTEPDPSATCQESRVGAPVLRRLTRAELAHSLGDVFPMLDGAWEGVRLGPDPMSKLGFSNDGATLLVSSQVLGEVAKTAEEVAGLLVDTSRLGLLLPCAEQSPDAACAEELIARVGRRLFRRPLVEEERGLYRDYFSTVETRSNFVTAAKWTLVALLESPHTLYRSELGQAASGERTLSPYEIASALSYTFGGSTPTEELLAKAEKGELDSAEARVTEARRLLDTPRGQKVMRSFFREWSGYTRVETQTRPDAPDFADVRPRMVAETERFFDEVIYAQGGGVRELLTADYSFPDATLAAYYGFEGKDGRVTKPAEWSVGLLSQGSILAGRAHANSSSPTQRGLFVFERLLCRERPPVPDKVPPIPPPMPGASTTRQRYEELHAADEFCASCHSQWDPVGFAFEHFDETGRYRKDESGIAIDASGTALAEDASVLFEFDGLTNLAHELASTPLVTDCVSGLLAQYAYGGVSQSCLAESARKTLATGEIGLLEFAARLAGEPHFTERQMP